LDIIAEFEIDKEALEKIAESNVEYECSTSGGASKRGALGPFGLYVLADSGLSEYTPVYFYVVKGSNGKLKTSFCSDQSRYLFNQIHFFFLIHHKVLFYKRQITFPDSLIRKGDLSLIKRTEESI
jgi:hypothetical protein